MLYLSLFVVSLISGCFVFTKQFKANKNINILLPFSGAYLLAICFLHLLPELFEVSGHSVAIYLLIGFFLQLILDYFSGGIEHGHVHVNKSKIGSFPFLIFISLGLHAFLEALPLHELTNASLSNSYLLGILFHKIPIALVLGSLLVSYQLKKGKIFFALLIFALLGPLGAFIGSEYESTTLIFQKFLAISIGIILHLSTTILLENNEDHHINLKKLFPIVLGVGLALLSLILH